MSNYIRVCKQTELRRKIALLATYNGFTHEDIATAFGLSRGRVTQILNQSQDMADIIRRDCCAFNQKVEDAIAS